jgi:hypothetical protein
MRTAYAFRQCLASSLVLALAACSPAAEDPAVQALAAKKSDACLEATSVTLGTTRLTIAGDTTDAGNKPEPCGGGGAIHGAAYYTFTVSAHSLLYVDTLGSSFDTVVGLIEGGCSGRERSCTDDACGGAQSQLVAIVEPQPDPDNPGRPGPPRTYVLAVGGKSAEDRGEFVVHAQLVAVDPVPAAGLASIEIPRGDFELVGTLGPGRPGGTRLGMCGSSFGEAWYWYASCPSDASQFAASTCNAETEFDAALSWLDVDDGDSYCCDELPNGSSEACIGTGMDQYPSQAAIQVQDEANDVGLHILKIGALGSMSAPEGEFHVEGSRL